MNPFAARACACRSAGMVWALVVSGTRPSVGCRTRSNFDRLNADPPETFGRVSEMEVTVSLGLSGLGISEEHAELATSLRKWAASLGGPEAARAAEADHHATF